MAKTFQLLYNGDQIATISDAEYATPTYGGKVTFNDPKVHQQFKLIADFEVWAESDEADSITDEEYDAEYARRGIEEKYETMLRSGGWKTVDENGAQLSADLLVFSDDYVEWRPGETQ